MNESEYLRELPATAGYERGDILVLVGELFGRGYATGIVEEARRRGMTVVGATVGRRANDGKLRPLTSQELADAEALLGGRIINIPLEAGFDMEPDDEGNSLSDQLKRIRPDDWEYVRLNWKSIEQSRANGSARFASALAAFVRELATLLPAGKNVLFVHTMAGGIPRARVFMPLMNRIFKGQGERFLASAAFWESDLGNLCRLNFDAVSADTFAALLAATAGIRESIAAGTGRVRYVAYGYHGCEVLVGGTPRMQSYTPYLPGWAKIRLEEYARTARSEGIAATVFNCPEIQTNSSALFLGVEISLYPFLATLEREGGGLVAAGIRDACRTLLSEGVTIEDMLARADAYLSDPLIVPFGDLNGWPHHNSREQMELMLTASSELLAMGRDPKEPVCAVLSHAVFSGVGRLMLDASWGTDRPVLWLNHDCIARRLVTD